MVFERDEDWRTVITVPWLKKKKGKRVKCENYRGIIMLSVAK